ncbi:hypothetical protein NEMIN01_0265 [Nematocida minor]|uniref:uncharacterized protein n=1 Tax=Nematocida minor TaxID=1912983 RepID=UPI00221E518D|nr:uncharacterized protein NEMIN01_0265 [Nematocida minor]KAI5189099.1 hypothetical protein NEMIN01_0265 [Nematocida minor]
MEQSYFENLFAFMKKPSSVADISGSFTDADWAVDWDTPAKNIPSLGKELETFSEIYKRLSF